ncbi:MAG: peptide deformylase [Alphaproteobacteria bacterium]|nr:peptide deformylase [Alphaproteobacteria bacterium]
MDIYKVIVLPNPVLRQKANAVTRVDDAVRAQMKKMVETMYAHEGVGLAANQVAMLNRIIVIDTARREHDTPNPIAMANPEIVWKSEETWDYKEGCLSIPQMYADVVRPKFIKVRYVDEKNQLQEMDAGGLAATCIQHEVDHLDGILFIDHLSRLKRDTLLKKYEKLQKEAGEIL